MLAGMLISKPRSTLLKCAVACMITGLSVGQDGPSELLQRCRTKITESLDRLPKYMCTQTIVRESFDARMRARHNGCPDGANPWPTQLASTDRLRLDVAMTSTGEMYSWVGERRFSDRDLIGIVREGAISSGSFAGFLSVIFRGNAATFRHTGEVIDRGRKLSEFEFTVPQSKSHYAYGQGGGRIMVGYRGTFRLDPTSADLVQLTIRTDRLPSQTQSCYATTTLNYSRVGLNGVDFVLPSVSELQIFHLNGGYSRNQTTFSSCHAFLGESTISFEDHKEDATKTQPKASADNPSLPPGLWIKVESTQLIDTDAAAGGDPIAMKLTAPLELEGKVIAPGGAAVGARILRIRRFHRPDAGISVEIRLETIEIRGVPVSLPAIPFANPRERYRRQFVLKGNVEMGVVRGTDEHSAEFVFRKPPARYVIGPGIVSEWFTKAATESDQK